MELRLSLRDEHGCELAFRVRDLTFEVERVGHGAAGNIRAEEYRLGIDAREMYRDAAYKLFGAWPPFRGRA